MRLLPLLVFVGFMGCHQKQETNTSIPSTATTTTIEPQTPSSFSTPAITEEKKQLKSLPAKTTRPGKASSYTDADPVYQQAQTESVPVFDADAFNLSVQQFIATTRSEILAVEQPEVFVLQPRQAATVKTTNGTVITINTSDLETIDGKPISGPIKLSVKEMLTTADLLKMHSPTVSNGDILETGGSWYISAISNGKELKIKNGRAYDLQVPIDQKSGPGFNIFYGNTAADGTVNWQSSQSSFASSSNTRFEMDLTGDGHNNKQTSKLSYSAAGLMTETPYTYYGEFVENYIELGMSQFDMQVLHKIKKRGRHGVYKTDTEPKNDYVVRRYVRHGGMSVQRKNGSSKYIFESGAGSNSYKLVIDSLALTGESPVLRNDTKKIILKKITEQLDKMAKARAEYLRSMSKTTFQNTVSVATAKVTGFGWINCDRFYKDKSERIEYNVYTKAETPADAMVVYMVFRNIRSLLNSNVTQLGSFRFSGVPADEEVRLVAIGKSGDQLLYAETGYYTLKKDQRVLLELQKITTGEMTAKINQIQ